MTDKPYTENDLRAEAAKQHHTATEDPDFVGISEQMEGNARWDSLNEDDFDAAHRAIDGILGQAANVSEWAINLGADGLEPTDQVVEVKHNGLIGFRVHFAFHPSMPAALRTAVIEGLRDEVEHNDD